MSGGDALRPEHEELAAYLAELIPDVHHARRIAASAGLKPPEAQDSRLLWRSAVGAAARQERLPRLLDLAGAYSAAMTADQPQPRIAREPMIDDPLAEPAWGVFGEPEMEYYQRRIGQRDTFLPVSFLYGGVVAARAVCKISYEKRDAFGSARRVFGTGFLIAPDQLLTCYHVLRNATDAAQARVEFAYEVDRDGVQVEPRQVALAPQRGFLTSGDLVHDWSIVRTEVPVGDEFGFLPLRPVDHAGIGFVNIVGHPGGRMKQLSLYNNLLESYTPDRVIYTTETDDGSSGSPVFDSDWRVVAMHNGVQHPFELTKLRRVVRNAGININRIIEQAGLIGETERP